MKIAYVTEYDARDINAWSGLGYFIAKSLEDQGAEIHYIDNLKTSCSAKYKILEKYFSFFFRCIYRKNRSKSLALSYARQIQKRLHTDDEVLLSPSSIPVSLLKSRIPIVFYTDATLASMIDFYPEFKKYCSGSIRSGHVLEKAAIQNAAKIIYSSEWAKNSAIKQYHADPGKIEVLPFGANFSSGLSASEVHERIEKRSRTQCRLLFLAAYWERKGGDIALKIAEKLNQEGLNCELHIAGLEKIPYNEIPPFVKIHGYINKAEKKGQEKISNLISQSHFLILPSRADCTPVVFSEANSFGVPCISSDVGGISSIISDDINGKLFSLHAEIQEYALYISNLFHNFNDYKKLAKQSYAYYKSNLNWEQTGKKIFTILQELG
jgi:glycosyltransferase involved in cell wall biosynthesis